MLGLLEDSQVASFVHGTTLTSLSTNTRLHQAGAVRKVTHSFLPGQCTSMPIPFHIIGSKTVISTGQHSVAR